VARLRKGDGRRARPRGVLPEPPAGAAQTTGRDSRRNPEAAQAELKTAVRRQTSFLPCIMRALAAPGHFVPGALPSALDCALRAQRVLDKSGSMWYKQCTIRAMPGRGPPAGHFLLRAPPMRRLFCTARARDDADAS